MRKGRRWKTIFTATLNDISKNGGLFKFSDAIFNFVLNSNIRTL